MASDLFGVSGRRMLTALIEGKRDAGWMADYARGTLRSKRDQLELALEGTFTDHRRHLLRRLVRQMNTLDGEISELTTEIEARVSSWEEKIARPAEISWHRPDQRMDGLG